MLRRPSQRALRVAWCSFAALAALHACSVARLLRRDADEPNFAGLPAEDKLRPLSREVVLMHHKRLQELNSTLTHLARLANADRLHVTVAQSLDASEAAAADASAALLRGLAASLRLNVSHRPVVRPPDTSDGTYSVDAARYGTKRNSFRNLLHGLDAVFARRPELRSAIVLEDDVILSVDALDFFDMAASLLASAEHLEFPERPVLATSFCFLREDHEDYGWWRHHALRRLVGGADRYRRGPLRSTTIKTFAWLATREVYESMRHDVLAGPAPMLALPAAAPLHASLAGCGYCENFCYDHYLEWRWRHASVVCPAVSRSRANFSGGMTERAGVLSSRSLDGHHARQRAGIELNAQRTRAWQFVDDAARRAAARAAYALATWVLPALLLLCVCSARAVTAASGGGGSGGGGGGASLRKAKREDDSGEDDSPPLSAPLSAPPPPPLPPLLLAWRRVGVVAARPRSRTVACALLLVGVCSAWAGVARAVRWAHTRSRTRTCLPLPPHAAPPLPLNCSGGVRHATGGGGGSGGGGGAPFVLLWSTGASSFGLRPRRTLESILYHHPRATLLVFSNLLPDDFFGSFSRLSYDVRVCRYDAAALLEGTPAQPWLDRLDEWRRGPYFYSHVTDALRLALLLRVGGVYLDFDVLLARPIHADDGAQTAAAKEAKEALPPPSQPPLRDALGIESYDGLGGLRGPTLNGAVMVFERGSRFVWNCLDDFAAQYMADRWSWNGPELLTRVRLRCDGVDGAQVQVEPRESFYPIYWKGLEAFADGRHPDADRQMWDTIRERSFTVHVWNRKTAGITFANGSLLHRLHNTWTVLPEREECT